jgi:hypothetical protein
MTQNSVLLKRAMGALGISGSTLARELSQVRDDGKETGQATVSRWLTGASPVEPAVLCWLRELLRAQAKQRTKSTICWNAKKSLLIGVGNSKGGVGTTSIAAALAVIAKRELHQPTRHIQVHSGDGGLIHELQAMCIDSRVVPIQDLSDCVPATGEIVIVDIPNHTTFDLLNTPDFSKLPFDVVLVPADFGSAVDLWGTRNFLEQIETDALITLLHYPNFRVDLDFARTANGEGFDVLSEQFVPFAIPRSSNCNFLPVGQLGGWQDEHQCHLFFDLFENLLERVGMAIRDAAASNQAISEMTLEEMLEILEH